MRYFPTNFAHSISSLDIDGISTNFSWRSKSSAVSSGVSVTASVVADGVGLDSEPVAYDDAGGTGVALATIESITADK